jgi:hypothetical protein
MNVAFGTAGPRGREADPQPGYAGLGAPWNRDLKTITLQAPEDIDRTKSMLRRTAVLGIRFRAMDVFQVTYVDWK